MGLSWEQMQGLLRFQSAVSCGGNVFSPNESAYRLACARKRNGRNQAEKWFPRVEAGQVVDSGKVKR